MAGPLTPKRQYDHVTETIIAFGTAALRPFAVFTKLTGPIHSRVREARSQTRPIKR